jgi:hypothetical protein
MMKVQVYNDEGHEVIGTIDVVKIEHDDGADRPYHLELVIEDSLLDEIVKFGSEVFGQLDLLQAGLRGALLERLAREKEEN